MGHRLPQQPTTNTEESGGGAVAGALRGEAAVPTVLHCVGGLPDLTRTARGEQPGEVAHQGQTEDSL